MNIAIYSRKSKFVEGSESIENQIEMCKQYINRNIKNVDNIFIYEDEGFSGGNINRPQFTKMMKDAKNKVFSILVCYRLDRISRNVADFSGIITELQDLNIDFISIREQFDTSNPMGRAMLYISSVFAQLERETIAERIRDNLLEMSKTGKWLGGKEPYGYILKNKGKDSFLYIDKKNFNIIKSLFEKYLEYDSLTQTIKYAIRNNIFTPNGKPLSNSSMHRVLSNPAYVIADEGFYNYAKNKHMTICNSLEEFKNNTEKGIMCYNKTSKSTFKVVGKKQEEWIVAIGQHKGIVKSDMWIKIQDRLKENASKAPNGGKSADALLGGIIKCANCGSTLRVIACYYKHKRKQHYYKCRTKAVSNCILCNIKNANGYETDKTVIDYIKQLGNNDNLIEDLFGERKSKINTNNTLEELKALEELIRKNESDIEKLTEKLIDAENSTASKYIVKKIEKIDLELKENNKKREELKSKRNESEVKEVNKEIFKQQVHYAARNIDSLSLEEQKKIVKNIFKEVVWDGEKLEGIPRI